ncbi:uncharacterized protein LOC142234912 [Haematobia irritans]|uniref:uncharacterized protein LOC142234912 n=1 Tax=Haematobia irritans TaxID=7368 RepID=UPI003F4FF5B0
MEELLSTTIQQMPSKPKILTKYVDDIFAIVKTREVDTTIKILNEYNPKIQFTMEKENDNKLPYLDSIVHRIGNVLKLDWYKKPPASGRLINFYSKHPRKTIINIATNFIRRVLNVSDEDFYEKNIKRIGDILHKNEFPTRTIQQLVKYVKEDKLTRLEDPKKYISDSYIPGFTESLENSNIFDKEKFQLAEKTHRTVNELYIRTKSKLKTEEKSDVVYKIKG